MKAANIILVAMMMALMASCSTTGIQVAYDYYEEAEFSGLKTYDWQPDDQASSEEELVLSRVRRMVDEQMQIKGYAKMSDSPDFLISAQLHRIREIKDWQYGKSRQGSDYSYVYEQGRLVLDFLDAETNEPIWRASATGLLIDSPDPQARDRDAGEAVRGMLENFPPPG